jgi:pimeloyl-ACP methyl ester carboxylesterase
MLTLSPSPAVAEDSTRAPSRAGSLFSPLQVVLWLLVAATLCLGLNYAFRLARAATVLGFSHGKKPRPLRFYDRFFGYKCTMADFSIPGTLGPVQLRVYTPIGKKHPLPILLVHGFAPQGNRETYLNLVAGNLTEMGYTVILPNIPAETQYEMRPSDMTVIGDAIHWGALATGEKVSVFGISFGAGLAIAAAAQPSVVGDVKLIFSLSGYNSLDSISHYYMHDRVADPYGVPYPGHPPGPLLIAYGYLSELVPARDFPAIRQELDRMNHNHKRTVGEDESTILPPDDKERQTIDELQTVDTPQMHQHYVDALQRHRVELAALSPASVLPTLRVPLYVLHGRTDPIFPEGEVEWMRKELGGNPNAHILVSPWISHAFVGQPATSWQKVRVISFASQLLYQASLSAPISHR